MEQNAQQFNPQQKRLQSHTTEGLGHDGYDISSEHNADISGEEHEWSHSETSSPGLSATSVTTDLFDSDPISGSTKPLLSALLNFISKTNQENKTHPSPSACFESAKLSLGRFRLWSRSFEGHGCDLSEIIDDSPSLKTTVISLLSSLTTVLVAEFGYLCDRETLIELKDGLSQIHDPDTAELSDQLSDYDAEEYDVDGETSSVDESTCSDDTSVVEQLADIVDSLFGLLPALHHLSKTTMISEERSQTFSQDNELDTGDNNQSSSNNESSLGHGDLSPIAEEPVMPSNQITPKLPQADTTHILEEVMQGEPAHTTLPPQEDTIVLHRESPHGKQKADTMPTIESATQSLPSKNMPKEPKFVQQPMKKIGYIDSTGPTLHPAAVATSPTGPSTRSGGAPRTRTSASTSGPLPQGTATESIIDQLDSQIHRSFREFHDHSKECRGCRNPILAYKEGRDLCYIGRGLTVNITKLLYKKAEYIPQGTFTVEYKQGWESVDGLIKTITHYNQGYFSNKIVDVKRVPRDTQPAAIENRGSQYEEDLRRHELAAARSAQQNGYGPHRRSLQRTNETLAVYGDPRTSFLDASTGRTWEDSSGPSSAASSAASSSRSGNFDTHIRVREYET